MFLGCLSFTEFPLNIQGTGPLIFAVQYISISLYIFTRYIYISVASRPELRILKLRFNILCSLRINLNTVILILHSACMPTYFCYIRLLVWSASRGHKYFIICYILCMLFFMSTVILLKVPLLSISMYSYYIYAYSTLRACSITYLFAIFFYVFL